MDFIEIRFDRALPVDRDDVEDELNEALADVGNEGDPARDTGRNLALVSGRPRGRARSWSVKSSK